MDGTGDHHVKQNKQTERQIKMIFKKYVKID
jgi:hypothetical protein